MNQAQATRLLGLDPLLVYLGRWDAQNRLVAGWHRGVDPLAVPYEAAWRPAREGAAARHAVSAAMWGSGGQLARQITVDELSEIMTILLPIPGGGFVVATLEHAVVDHVAGQLADRLDAALQREFGPTAAPYIAAGIAALALVALVGFQRSREAGAT
jgi:hypothetical protein